MALWETKRLARKELKRKKNVKIKITFLLIHKDRMMKKLKINSCVLNDALKTNLGTKIRVEFRKTFKNYLIRESLDSAFKLFTN